MATCVVQQQQQTLLLVELLLTVWEKRHSGHICCSLVWGGAEAGELGQHSAAGELGWGAAAAAARVQQTVLKYFTNLVAVGNAHWHTGTRISSVPSWMQGYKRWFALLCHQTQSLCTISFKTSYCHSCLSVSKIIFTCIDRCPKSFKMVPERVLTLDIVLYL